jgi:hypothetical protein
MLASDSDPGDGRVAAVSADPAERLRLACLAAIERCEAKEREGINPDTFAELGESLFWLLALAEASGRHKTELLRGLGWARDRIAHGVLLTAPVSWHYGTELGKWVLGRGALGTSSGHEWRASDAVLLSRTQRRDPTGEAAYDIHLAGRRVIAVLRAGLAEALGPD